MVGAMPRKEGMERKDLLAANVKIFKVQGQALDQYAKKSVKVLVVGNPANTNAFIMSHYAPSIPKANFTAMTRLDQNRASAQLAQKAGVGVEQVKKCFIWGNHSSTQFPDASNATIGGKPGGLGHWPEDPYCFRFNRTCTNEPTNWCKSLFPTTPKIYGTALYKVNT